MTDGSEPPQQQFVLCLLPGAEEQQPGLHFFQTALHDAHFGHKQQKIKMITITNRPQIDDKTGVTQAGVSGVTSNASVAVVVETTSTAAVVAVISVVTNGLMVVKVRGTTSNTRS